MENWDEVRTAFQVARLGTVSGAADVLGVHHATVIRHIDSLEKRLGTKLFQRHARGYTPTEAGRDLLSVAQSTEDQFAQLSNRIKGHGEEVAGELIITSLTGASDLLVPALAQFQEKYPLVNVRFLTDVRVYRLDYGEAHVAIRAGSTPEELDNVVQPLVRVRYALYAHKSYAARYGLPASEADFASHRFICAEGRAIRAPFFIWLCEHIKPNTITFSSLEHASLDMALSMGAGLGFMPCYRARLNPDLIEVLPARPDWDVPLWLVTHVDLHRTRKVQTFVSHLKEIANGWQL